MHEQTDAILFLHGLQRQVVRHRAVHHPYLHAMNQRDWPDVDGAIADLSQQYRIFPTLFSRCMHATMSQVRQLRPELLADTAIPCAPPVAARRIPVPVFPFLKEAVDEEFCSEARAWDGLMMSICSSGGPEQGIGALGLGTLSVLGPVHQEFLMLLRDHSDPTSDLCHSLERHIDCSRSCQQVLQRITTTLAADPDCRPGLERGAIMALSVRNAFFDVMYRRASSMRRRRRQR